MKTINSTSAQQIHQTTLENGLTLLTITNPSSDIISGKIFIKNAGSRSLIPEKAGLSHLVASVITKGTEKLNAVDIAYQIESIGASLGAEATSDYSLISLKTVSNDFRQILNLAAEIIRFPSFPETEVKREKYLTQQSILSQQESPFNLAFNQLKSVIYQDHPYSLSVLGTEESIESLTKADLHAYHEKHFRPDQMVISLCGRIDPDLGKEWVEAAFGDQKNPESPLVSPNFLELQPQPETVKLYQDTQQSIVMLGYLTPGVKSEEYPVLKLINTYLGNGLSSRLFVELREKRGLAYDVSAFYPTRIDQSNLISYMGTSPENTAIAQAGLKAEVERLCETLLTETELQVAKNKLLGQYALGKQSNGEIAQIFGWYETLELGIDFDSLFPDQVNAVTSESIKEVAQKYLTKPYISLVGPIE